MLRRIAVLGSAALTLMFLLPSQANAQGRGRANSARPAAQSSSGPSLSASVSISLQDRETIREFYVAHQQPPAESLPPGIRRNLERGKALPPGIAKKSPPTELRSRLSVPERFEVVEVGLDVLLVEVATGVIHDVLMDVIR